MSSFLEQLTVDAKLILDEIEVTTSQFAETSGIRCRQGCGQCCLKPGVEAQVVELLPLAQSLLKGGTADAFYDQAAQTPDGRCIFYAPNPQDETLGRCTQYALRPSLCRLFGFAAVSSKDGRPPALAACHWHKRLQPDVVEKAQRDIDAGAFVPKFSDYSLRFRMLAPTPSLSERLPINRAFMRAVEKLGLAGG